MSADATDRLSVLETALSHIRDGDPMAAIDAVSTLPDRDRDAPSCCILAMAAFLLDDKGRAIALLRAAHELDANCREYADMLAGLLTRCGKLEEGLFFSKLSVTMEPSPLGLDLDPFGLSNYFQALRNVSPPTYYKDALLAFLAHDYRNALAYGEREISLNPGNARCHVILGRSLMNLGELPAAVSALQVAASLVPEEGATYLHLAEAHDRLGHFDLAAGCRRQAARLAPQSNAVRVATMAGLARADDAVWQLHAPPLRAAINDHLADAARQGFQVTPAGGDVGRLVVGVISDQLYSSPVMSLVEPILLRLPDESTDLILYHQALLHDAVSVRLKSVANGWHDAFETDDETLATIVAGDEVDVLLDLCGYSELGRLPLYARRPAEVIAAWMGAPVAAGSVGVDTVLSAQATLEADEEFAECEPLLLSNGLMALEPMAEMGEPGLSPHLKEGVITFGAILDLATITPDTAALWADVLRAVPQSRLLLGKVDSAAEQVLLQVHSLFADYGVSDRLIIQMRSEDVSVDDDFFRKIDIFLDPTPLSQPLAVAQALWMGVPALCVMEGRRSARLGACVLQAAGRAEWISPDRAGLAAKALALCVNPARLQDLRATLREQVAQAPLFRPELVAGELRAALRRRVAERRAGRE